MRIKADLTLFLVAVIWGSAFVAQRLAGQLGSVYYFNGARYLLAALIVFPFAFRNRSQRLSNPLTKEQYTWMFIAGLLLFLGSSFRQAGLVFTTAGNAGFITSLYVVLIPVFLILFWSEGRHWLSIVAVVAAGVGAFLLSTAGEFKLHTGDLLELIGASFWAFHVIVLGKYASKFDALSISVGQLVICGLLNLVPGFFVEQGVPITWPLISAVLYTALFSLGLCCTLQIWAQRHPPQRMPP